MKTWWTEHAPATKQYRLDLFKKNSGGAQIKFTDDKIGCGKSEKKAIKELNNLPTLEVKLKLNYQFTWEKSFNI